jgi:Cu/Ag efflux protein CusF
MRHAPTPVLVLLLLGALASLACEENKNDEPLPPADATYTVRGMIRELPPQGTRDDVLIHHEAMEDFKDRDGDNVGMKAMVMPFTPARGLPLEELSKGDRVQFTFEVRWGGDPMMRLTHVEKLPEGTQLAFEK